MFVKLREGVPEKKHSFFEHWPNWGGPCPDWFWHFLESEKFSKYCVAGMGGAAQIDFGDAQNKGCFPLGWDVVHELLLIS